MFRPMRRFKQQLSENEYKEILNKSKSGVLAVIVLLYKQYNSYSVKE